MKNQIHKKYESINDDGRKVIYEIVAQDELWYVIYAGYIVHQERNKDDAEYNFEIAKSWLFSKSDYEFKEIE